MPLGLIFAAAAVSILVIVVIPDSILPEQKTQKDLAVAGIIFFILLGMFFGWRIFASRDSDRNA
ncbi:MAG: hypothetical protein AAGD14_10445 [Planctomycetota bacterium]